MKIAFKTIHPIGKRPNTAPYTAAAPASALYGSTFELPMFRKFKKLGDCSAMFDIAAVGTPEYWLPYGSMRYHVPMSTSCTAVSAATYYPFFIAGQFKGDVNVQGNLTIEREEETAVAEPTDAAGFFAEQVGRQKMPVVRTPTKKIPSKVESRLTSARYIASAGGSSSGIFIGVG